MPGSKSLMSLVYLLLHAAVFGQKKTQNVTHRIASEPSLWRNDAQRNVHQAGAPLPFDRGTAGTIRAQGQKLSIVF